MKITLSNDPNDEGKEGIVYVPLSLFASIVATLHERELLPKAQVLPTKRALDAADWTCKSCSFENHGSWSECGECQTPRQ